MSFKYATELTQSGYSVCSYRRKTGHRYENRGHLMAEYRKAIDEVKMLLDSNDTDKLLRTCAERILELTAPSVDLICNLVKFPIVSRDLAIRCIIKRAQECFSAVVDLVDHRRGHVAMALLRPMCEDYIFAEWLLTLPKDLADNYVRDRATEEILSGQIAQARFFPRARERFGRESRPADQARIDALEESVDLIRKKIRASGERLGWGRQLAPSVQRMAKDGSNAEVYEFFYRGASRAVHSSLHQMIRMVWGDFSSGEFSIASTNFEQYYRRFALVYMAHG
jgi:Family of unknown function (DUF5677)